MIRENGKIVRCPICKSSNVKVVMPFDYAKMCMNNKCKYHLEHKKEGFRHCFSTGVHN